ncbi:glycosyltransferase [Ensifer adhaerens]|uniref:glycosyltransferase n=1 Tax=Ensifer adhaerens TaxID=106592 RepID=UPI003CFF7B5C
MRIVIHVYGTRDDVEPFIALANRLHLAGYAVQLAGPRRFAPLTRGHGALYEPLPDDFLALRERDPSRIERERFCARRVHDLGAGPPPAEVKRLSVERMTALMRAMDTPLCGITSAS